MTTSTTVDNTEYVNPLVQNERWITVTHTAQKFDTGFRYAHSIINDNLTDFTKGTVLYKNTQPHMTGATTETIQKLKFEILPADVA
jgi:hypothetical protein